MKEPSLTAKKKQRKPSYNLANGVHCSYVTANNQPHRYWYYVATFKKREKILCKRFSIAKHGEEGAKLLATLQRMAWLIEHKVWTPDCGDPMGAGTLMNLYRRNQEYKDCKIEGVTSPYLHEWAS